jgi:hypothetical protein
MHKLQKRYQDARKIFYISTIVAMYLFKLFSKANSQNNRSSGNRFEENQRITKD